MNAGDCGDGTSAHGIISGLWLSSLTLGGFFGPTLGGLLHDTYGFRTGTLFVICGNIFLAVVLLPIAFYKDFRRRCSEKPEKEPLLRNKEVVLCNT